jgi:unsaturated rhamnogalacturonyl hydrolase
MKARFFTCIFLFSSIVLMLSSGSSTHGVKAGQPAAGNSVYFPLITKPDFTYPHQLTTESSQDIQPAFSPDGQSIVFISDRAGQSDVFKMSRQGGAAVNLTQTLARQEDTPTYSPDGGLIAYASNATASGDWDIFTMNPDGTNKQAVISHAGSDEMNPWFSPDGGSLYFSSNANGDWDIYLASMYSTIVTWTQLTYSQGADRFPVLSPDGTTVVFRSERDGNSEVYVMDPDGSNQHPFFSDPAFDSHGEFVPDMSGLIYDSNQSGATVSYLVNPAATSAITLEQRTDWQMMHSNVSADNQWRVYVSTYQGNSDIYIDKFTTPMLAMAQQGADNMQSNCDWDGGVLAYGWSKAWQATSEEVYWDWIREYVNRCLPTAVIDHVNDGLLGYSALISYENDPQPAYLDFAQAVADWLMNDAPRTPDGTLSHGNGSDLVACDTMISVIPFLTEMTRITGDTAYLDEAVSQVLKHANRLQDPLSGLYHHAWSYHQNQFVGPLYWSRGNGWIMVGDVEVLGEMDAADPDRVTILNLLKDQAAALKSYQDNSGLWPNVVDHPENYLETSGTAMIGYAIKQGIREGWLDSSTYSTMAQTAILGVWRKVLADGTLTDVQSTTGYWLTAAEYNAVPHDQLQLFGQGIGLLNAIP